MNMIATFGLPYIIKFSHCSSHILLTLLQSYWHYQLLMLCMVDSHSPVNIIVIQNSLLLWLTICLIKVNNSLWLLSHPINMKRNRIRDWPFIWIVGFWANHKCNSSSPKSNLNFEAFFFFALHKIFTYDTNIFLY